MYLEDSLVKIEKIPEDNFNDINNANVKIVAIINTKSVKLKYNNPIYKITTHNNKELLVTDNHIHLTQKGDVQTTDLTTEDYIAFNARPLDSFPEKDLKNPKLSLLLPIR